MAATNAFPHRFRMPSTGDVELSDPPDPATYRQDIEPWLAAMFQSEHLALLVGNGLTMATSFALKAKPPTMDKVAFPEGWDAKIMKAAAVSAARVGRGAGNLEDQLRAANELRAGLIVQDEVRKADEVGAAMSKVLHDLLRSVLGAERAIATAYADDDSPVKDLLGSFLLSFAGRSSSRERLNLFTTNYDRLLEFACERLGIRLLDRFVGSLSPIFRSSRLEIDIHYNPPGIRGEPRALEGIVKLTKLHGSIDWRFDKQRVRRIGLPFGANEEHPDANSEALGGAGVIFPMAAKDVETSAFPYSELFRDFSAAICRPNSVLVTYGYGFGDSHINSAIADMLTIPSTHLVVISFDEADGRIRRFVSGVGHDLQVSYLIGSHFGSLPVLVEHYLPKPAIDPLVSRRATLLQSRGTSKSALASEAE